MQRLAKQAILTYDALCEQLATEPVVTSDETGWRVKATSAWLWALTSPTTTVYAIEASRGAEVAASIIGRDYSGTLVRDGWAPYRQFTEAAHQSCLAHLLRRRYEILETARAGTRRVPLAAKRLLLDALDVRDRRDTGALNETGGALRGRMGFDREEPIRRSRLPSVSRGIGRQMAHMTSPAAVQ